MDFPNTTTNVGSGDRLSSTPSSLLPQPQQLHSAGAIHSVSPEIYHAGLQEAVNAASRYFYSLQEKENASTANKPGAYRVDVLDRETPIPKKN